MGGIVPALTFNDSLFLSTNALSSSTSPHSLTFPSLLAATFQDSPSFIASSFRLANSAPSRSLSRARSVYSALSHFLRSGTWASALAKVSK
jgi:hypothetical protein